MLLTAIRFINLLKKAAARSSQQAGIRLQLARALAKPSDNVLAWVELEAVINNKK